MPHEVRMLLYLVSAALIGTALIVSWSSVRRLRNTNATYNARLLPFAYYSLLAWTFWLLGYFPVAVQELISPTESVWIWIDKASGAISTLNSTFLCLAAFALYSRAQHRARVVITVGLALWLGALPYLLGSPSWEMRNVWTLVTLLDALAFWAFIPPLRRLRLGWRYSAPFAIYGILQIAYLVSTPDSPHWAALIAGAVLLRGALLVAWNRVIVFVLTRAERSHESAVAKINALGSLPDLTRSFQVMISSTVDDLAQERDAADQAIASLHLERFRAETFGSISNTPRSICEIMARSCDLMVLIIGERYGHVISPEAISVVEFEFNVARAADPLKILVYVKDVERHDERLLCFVKRLEDFDNGYFRSVFRTPEALYERIHTDVARWLVRRAGVSVPAT